MDKLSNLPSGGCSLLYLCSYLDPGLIIMVEGRSGPGQGRAGRRILVHIERLILMMVALVGLIRHYWHVVVDGWLLRDKSKLCLIRHIVVGQCVELLPPSLRPGGRVLIIQNKSTWKMKQWYIPFLCGVFLALMTWNQINEHINITCNLKTWATIIQHIISLKCLIFSLASKNEKQYWRICYCNLWRCILTEHDLPN